MTNRKKTMCFNDMSFKPRHGIIMAAGKGTRLMPTTLSVSKHLLPVFNKPMIFYPLTTLMLSGVRTILIITNPEHLTAYQALLGDGSQWGIKLTYAVQEEPKGIPDGLIIGKAFLKNRPSVLILGDNIFYGDGLPNLLQSASRSAKATILAYKVKDPKRYAVIDYAANGEIADLVEKPSNPTSDFVVPGIYFLPDNASTYAEKIIKSKREELEVTDLLKIYLSQGNLDQIQLGRGMTWFDVGTHESLIEASQFVRLLERRQGQRIACPDEVAKNLGFLSN